MSNYCRWIWSVTKCATIFFPLIICLCLWGENSNPILFAQEQLDIERIDLSHFPKVSIITQHTSLSTKDVRSLLVYQDEISQNVQISSLPQIRVGVLADIYLGLDSNIAIQLADAVDALDKESWQWEQMERALFVPVGDDGREVIGSPNWTDESWRSASNGIAAYYNGQDDLIRPKATKTALIDLIISAIDVYADATSTQNHLIVLTDGFDRTSKMSIEEIVTRAQQYNVTIHLVNYNGLSVGSTGYVLENIAKALQSSSHPLTAEDGLSKVWQQIAQQPLRSTFTYQTKTAPPFAISLQGGTVQSNNYVVNEEIPSVVAKVIEPAQGKRLTSTNLSVKLKLEWGKYPPRALREIRYSLAAGREWSYRNPKADKENIVSFVIFNLPAGEPLLDIIIDEEINGFSDVVQSRLNVVLPPMPTAIPTITPTTVPSNTPTPTATATTIWDGYIASALTPVATWIPETIRTNRNFTQPLRLILPLLALIAFVLAWMAWRRAKTVRIIRETYNSSEQTTNKTTAVPMDTRPKAQLVLIQGERSLPAIISLYQGRTKFGRDPSWSDEVLPNRFVSLQQFAITLDDEYQNLANFSVNHHTHLDDIAAEEGSEEDPEKGSPLRSGSIIQFGPFKYKFQFISQFDSAGNYHTNHSGSKSSIGSPRV